MRKLMIIVFATVCTVACNNQPAAKENSAAMPDSTDAAEKIDYAYLPEDHPADYWDRGDQKNVAMVLKCLKAFENGNIEESLVPFADSVTWSFEGFDAKISKDSLRSMFKYAWKNMSSIKISMSDYEAVTSKDKKEEYVTLWYKQVMTDKSGKKDSAAYVNDLKIENGKIILLDEKSRKYPVKK